jgi:hypothetical protein
VLQNVRNFAIVALLALAVWALPGGGTAADVFQALLFIVVTVGVGILAARFYLENRSDIYGLGDRWRLLFYGALGLIVLAMAATPKLFSSGPGSILWVLLIVGSLYALFRVWRQSREY